MSNTEIDIRTEPLLGRTWKFNRDAAVDASGDMLITGANSFIGCHVLHLLSKQFSGNIHLLVRAPGIHDAAQKMIEAFGRWSLGVFHPERFVFHCGDVCEPMMGLSAPDFKQLQTEVSQVVHLAMNPMYHLPYHHFQRVWLPELERMIEFCGTSPRPKSLHYASSFNANFFQTDDDFAALNTNAWQSGYAGFKWVACQSILHAMKQNLRGCIYDIPLVLGSESVGTCPIHYSIWMILEVFLKTKMYFPFSFKIIPVDSLAEVMVINLLKERNAESAMFLRPMLEDPVTDRMFSRTIAMMLGLKKEKLEIVRGACQNKLRFDFMMPANFYELLEKVNQLPVILPEGYDEVKLPTTLGVFMSNLNRIMSVKHELIKT